MLATLGVVGFHSLAAGVFIAFMGRLSIVSLSSEYVRPSAQGKCPLVWF